MEKLITKDVDAKQIKVVSIDASRLTADPEFAVFHSNKDCTNQFDGVLNTMLDEALEAMTETKEKNAIVAKVKKMYHDPVEVDVFQNDYECIGFPTTSIFITQKSNTSIEISEFRYQRDELVAVRGNVFLYEIEKMKEALKP
jgi:hypothetical protein